jgi:hypothetical protein
MAFTISLNGDEESQKQLKFDPFSAKPKTLGRADKSFKSLKITP